MTHANPDTLVTLTHDTKCSTCGGRLRTVSMTTAQPAPYPPFTTTFTHPCEVCEVDE